MHRQQLTIHVSSSPTRLQEGDKLTDEDLYRFLGEMRRPAAAINKKFKIIPGHLKMDIQQPQENLPCCLTSNLFEVSITVLQLWHKLLVLLQNSMCVCVFNLVNFDFVF